MNYSKMNIKELKAICKKRKIKGISGKNKKKLIEMIMQRDATPVSAPKIETETIVKVESVEAPMNSEEASEPNNLQKVFHEVKQYLTSDVMKNMVSKMNAISEKCRGDGAGLTGGVLIDMFLIAYLSDILKSFTEYRSGESDCKILDVPFSMKKISGKSTIALDWSKNGENSKKRDHFDTDIMIINLKTEQWWKKGATGCTQEEKDSMFYSKHIKAGIYLISKTYCKNNIHLTSNNKSNSIIDQKSLYQMLTQSMKDGMVIEFPPDVPKHTFNILGAFT